MVISNTEKKRCISFFWDMFRQIRLGGIIGSLKPETCTNSNLLALDYHDVMHVDIEGFVNVHFIML